MGRFSESMWCAAACAACFGIAVIGVGCGGEGTGDSRGTRVEGTEPGDCEDGADNDADGLFDCADPSCEASLICGHNGAGGADGSLWCADINCDDQNGCTEDSCDPVKETCVNAPKTNGVQCDFDGLPGVCGGGVCEDAMRCGGVDCDDQNGCTVDTCNPSNGTCGNNTVANGTACDFGDLPGICAAGVCEDAMLCAGVDCDDGNQCTVDTCDPADGRCDHANVVDLAACDFGGLPGICIAGVCEDAMLCAGVDCDDGNECTVDTCDPADGLCGHANVAGSTACDFGGLPGICTAGTCEDAMLCAGVVCDDGNECTVDDCDPMDGQCDFTDFNGVTCDFAGLPGLCTAGVCEDAMLCAGVNCDDANECTVDVCNPLDGLCSHSDQGNYTTCDFGGSSGLCIASECADDPCDPNPCLNGGTCSSILEPPGPDLLVANCSCPPNYKGVLCEIAPPPMYVQSVPVIMASNVNLTHSLATHLSWNDCQSGQLYRLGETRVQLDNVDLDYDAGSVTKVELCGIAGAVQQGSGQSFWPMSDPPPPGLERVMCLLGPMSQGWLVRHETDEVGVNPACEDDVGIAGFYDMSGSDCVEIPLKTPGASTFGYYAMINPGTLVVFSGIVTWLDKCSSGLSDYRNNFYGSEIRVTFDFTSAP